MKKWIFVIGVLFIAILFGMYYSLNKDSHGSPSTIIMAFENAFNSYDVDAMWNCYTERVQGLLNKAEFTTATKIMENIGGQVEIEILDTNYLNNGAVIQCKLLYTNIGTTEAVVTNYENFSVVIEQGEWQIDTSIEAGPPTIKITDINPTLNLATARIQGTVTGVGYEENTKHLSFQVSDNENTISVSAYEPVSTQLVENGNDPSTGDWVKVIGSLRTQPLNIMILDTVEGLTIVS